jgi:hypothetical protein
MLRLRQRALQQVFGHFSTDISIRALRQLQLRFTNALDIASPIATNEHADYEIEGVLEGEQS